MAELTWRNVDNPDFGRAIEGVNNATKLLNQGLQSGINGLDKFGEIRTNNADKNILARQLQYQDPEAYKQALMDGTILGNDQAYASAEALAGMDKRVGTVVDNAKKELDYQKTGYDFDRAKGGDALMEKYSPQILQAQYLSANNRWEEATNILKGLNLRPEQMEAILTSGASSASSSRTLSEGNYTQANKVQNDNNIKTGNQLGMQLLQYIDPAEAEQQYHKLVGSGKYNPETLAHARNIMTGAGRTDPFALTTAGAVGGVAGAEGTAAGVGGIAPDMAGVPLPDTAATSSDSTASNLVKDAANTPNAGFFEGRATATGAEGFGTRKGNPYDSFYGFGQYGRTEKPLTTLPIKDVIAFGRDVLIPNTMGKVKAGPEKGTSASGLYQFTQETLTGLGKKVLGENWESEPFSPANQEKLAEALFNERKGGNLKATWASLPNAKPGFYKDKTWADMRKIISKGEVGVDISELENFANNNNKSQVQLMEDFAKTQAAKVNNTGSPIVDNAMSAVQKEMSAPKPGMNIFTPTQEVANTASAVINRLNERDGQDNIAGLSAEEYTKALEDKSNPYEMAVELTTADNSPLKGADTGTVMTLIETLMKRKGKGDGKITAGIVGALMRKSVKKEDNLIQRGVGLVADTLGAPFGREIETNNLGNGFRLNDEKIYKDLDEVRSGNAEERALVGSGRAATKEAITTAKTLADTKAANYQRMAQLVKTRPTPENNAAVARAKADYEKAIQQFYLVAGTANRTDANKPDRRAKSATWWQNVGGGVGFNTN